MSDHVYLAAGYLGERGVTGLLSQYLEDQGVVLDFARFIHPTHQGTVTVEHLGGAVDPGFGSRHNPPIPVDDGPLVRLLPRAMVLGDQAQWPHLLHFWIKSWVCVPLRGWLRWQHPTGGETVIQFGMQGHVWTHYHLVVPERPL